MIETYEYLTKSVRLRACNLAVFGNFKDETKKNSSVLTVPNHAKGDPRKALMKAADL